jgi:hypothetical protein
MSFRVAGLSAEPFRHLFGLPDDALARHGALRCVADEKPGFPDRIELRDVEPGERVLLVNHIHLPSNGPYRASHAVYVREGAETTYNAVDQVPDSLRTRLLSVRAFDADDMMVDADIAPGTEAEALIERLLAQPAVAYLHVHYARRGCYACRVERA